MPPVDEIDYFTSAANYVPIYSASMVYRTRSTIKGIEQHLDPQKLGRIHRFTIVNFDRVKAGCFAVRGDYILTLNDGTQLRMSRRH
jgi:two-component system, LytTR family, response regulator